jgi:hypothetical protein
VLLKLIQELEELQGYRWAEQPEAGFRRAMPDDREDRKLSGVEGV